MWRSVTRKASLYKGLNHFPHLERQHQVSFSKTLISAEILFPAVFCPKSHFHQTPLILSQDSLDPYGSNAEISEIGGKNSESFDLGDDAHNMFDKMPSLDSAVTEGDDAEIWRAGSDFVKGFNDSTNVLDNIPSIDSEEDGLARSSSPSICGDDLNVEGFDCGGDEKNDGSEVQGVISEELKNVLSLLQSTCVSVASSLPPKLDNLNPSLSEEFLLRITETPVLPGGILIAFFRWVLSVEKKSLVTTRVLESLVRVIGKEVKRNSAYALWDFLKEFGEEGLLTTCILNDLLSLLSELAKGKAGFEVFNKFEEFGCVPDESSFYFTIEALCRRSLFPWAVSVCENMINAGKLPDSQRIGKIISYLCKGKRARDAHSVYLSAKKMDRCPPRTTVNFLICSLSREDANVHLALEMLEEIPKKERKYAIKMFSSVICGLCRISEIEKAKILLFDMIEAGPPPGNAVFNTIINSLSKAGEMGEAQKIMELMDSRGLRPDVYTYSVIMSGYAKGGEMDEACKVLAEAKKQHKILNPITYHTIIRGYCRLENFDKALELLNEMKQSGLQPTADEYNKLIQSLCLKALDWETAIKLTREMEDNGFRLNGITMGLIGAVRELEKEEASMKEVGVEA